MTKTWPIIVLGCGIVALVGFLLPLVSAYGESISGWDVISEFGIGDATESWLMFIGTIILLISAIIAVAALKVSPKVVFYLSIAASLGAALAIGGASWFLFEAIDYDFVESLSYGFYISYATAALGLIFGIISIINSQRAGFQITLVVNKLSIGLVLFFIGILTIFLTIRITEGWSMQYLGQVMIVLFIGGLLAIAGLLLLVIYIISWLEKRRH